MKRKPASVWAIWCKTIRKFHAPLNWIREGAEITAKVYTRERVIGCGPHRLVEFRQVQTKRRRK